MRVGFPNTVDFQPMFSGSSNSRVFVKVSDASSTNGPMRHGECRGPKSEQKAGWESDSNWATGLATASWYTRFRVSSSFSV